MKFFTITARNYLSLALTLADSVKNIHPESEFTIVVSDGLDGLDNIRYKLVSAKSIVDDDKLFKNLAFKYNITEFCTSIKPIVFEYIFDNSSENETVFYLDPDTYLFSSIKPILECSDSKDLFLTPHIIECNINYIHVYPEYKHLWEGIFNLGFCGIKNTIKGRMIINWWKKRLIDYCYADCLEGLHTDQKWMDYAPVYFTDELEIVKHPGCNVSHWNINERNITKQDDIYYVNKHELVFFHFSGFDFSGKKLTKHVDAGQQSYLSSEVLFKLSEEYRKQVIDNGFYRFIEIPYKWNFYDNGMAILPIHRRLYRAAFESISDNPFNTNSIFYKKILRNKLLANSKVSIDYSSKKIINLGKKEALFQAALYFILKLIGLKNYNYMIKAFYKYSKLENHIFLIKK